MSKFAAIQMASGPQLSANLLAAEQLIKQAADEGAEFIVLPENFALMGKTEQDKLTVVEEPGDGPQQEFLSEQAKRHRVWICGGTVPLKSPDPERVYAANLVFDSSGQQVARYDKIHLFDVQLLDTKESYIESETILSGNKTVTFDSPFGRIGLATCYDLRFPELFRELVHQGAEIILLPAAFTEFTGKAHWEILLRARAIENLSFIVAAAQGGYHINGRSTYGHSMIVDPWGNIIEHLESSVPGVALGDIQCDYLHSTRRSFPTLTHRRLPIASQ